MITNAQIKLVRSLQQKKFRDETRLFVAEGKKLIDDLRQAFDLEFFANYDNATTTQIQQMSSLRSPQGEIAVFKQRPISIPDAELPISQLVLALDDVQDPGNLGTIIRTADWFGIHHIVCSLHTADCYNPKVVQATMGALARVHLHYVDLPQWLNSCKQAGSPIYGTLLNGKNIYEQHLSNCGIIVMGNEGNGISASVRSIITCPLFLPPYPLSVTSTSESLNVAIATAVTLAEFRRPK